MIGGHGGNIFQVARRLGCPPAAISDMSANVNPLGPMPKLMAHLRHHLETVARLPEVDAGGIVAAFAGAHGIDPCQVMAGNGTTELIYAIPRALESRRALVVGPTYADYRDACAMHGVPCDHLISRAADAFVPDWEAVRRAAASADLLFLCNPNNPTGTLADRSAIDRLCRALPDTTVVVDESYLPFAPDPAAFTMIRSDHPNLMVLNSMSKAFRIPGLRIGFVKASPALIRPLAARALPWSVNSLAQAAVRWLMTHSEPVDQFLSGSRRFLEKEKVRIEEYIHETSGVRCFPSAASFVLMRLPRGLTAPRVWAHMADNRILIRDCSNFEGLSDAFIRISLKSEAENQRAARLLTQLSRGEAAAGGGDDP